MENTPKEGHPQAQENVWPTLPPAQAAILTVSLKLAGANVEELLSYAANCERVVLLLVHQFRTARAPLREGSAVRDMLLLLYPGLKPESVRVTPPPEYDPNNPWDLLALGEAQAAADALRAALGWPERFGPQARIILDAWA